MSSAMGCPHCRNVIQTAHAVPAGKQVKCPHCKGFFLAPPTVPLPVAQIVGGPPVAPMAPMAPMIAPSPLQAALNVPPPPPPPAHAIMPPPPGARPAMPPPPPPTSSKKHKKDRKHRKHRRLKLRRMAGGGGKGLVKILLAALAFFVLLGVGAGAFMFFNDKGNAVASTEEEEPTEVASATEPTDKTPATKATEAKKDPTPKTETTKEAKKDPPPAMKGPEDPLALVPADSAVILGGNLKVLAEIPAFKGVLAGPLAKLSADLKRDVGMELHEFAESALVALHGAPTDLAAAKTTLILKSAAAYDMKKLIASPAVGDKAEVKGWTYYKLKPDSGLAQGRADAVLFAASDRILVLSDLPKAEFDKLIGGDLTKPGLPETSLAVITELQKQPAWAYLPLTDGSRKLLETGLMTDKAPAELKPAAAALSAAPALAMWAVPDEAATLLAIALVCADDAAAKGAVDSLTAYWKLLKAPGAMMAKLPPEVGKLVAELRAGAEFSQKGPVAIASTTLPLEPLAGLLASGEAGVKASYPQWLAGLAPPPPFVLSKEEQTVLDLTNKAREDAKLPALKFNPVLMKMARDHAANMAKQEKAEDTLDGKDHMARLADAGYAIKEKMSQANLVSADATVLTPAVAVEAWLGDDASKMNILGKYTEIGIGIAISDKKVAYYYQVFAVPEE